MALPRRAAAAGRTKGAPGAGRGRGGGAWHRRLDHTSDLELELGAPDLGGLLAEAGRALARAILGRRRPASGEWRVLEVQSRDREALLIDWLNELLFVAETKLWVPSEFEVLENTGTAVRMRARGVEVTTAPSLVKAATHHGCEIRDVPAGVVAKVILDL